MLVSVLAIALCVLAVSASPAAEVANDVQSSTDQVHAVWISNHVLSTFPIQDHAARKKRQVAWEESEEDDLDESTMCVLNCAMQFKTASRRLPQSATDFSNDGSLTRQELNMTQFIETCRIVRPSVQCFDQCPESRLKDQLKKSLELLRYVCVERYDDINKNARCMSKLSQEVTARCTPQCRRYEAAVTRLKLYSSRPYLRYLYTQAQVQDMLSDTCKFIQCQTDCSAKLLRRTCGDKSAELTKGITQRLMAAVQESAGAFLPESCTALAEGRSGNYDSDGTIDLATPEPFIRRARPVPESFDNGEDDE